MTITLDEVKSILADAAEGITAPVRVTPRTAEAYWKNLGDLSPELFQAAVDYCVQEVSQFFPSINQIRDAARTLIGMSIGIPSPAEAWAQVQVAKERVSAVYCETGVKMRDDLLNYIGGDYLKRVKEFGMHTDECAICREVREQYVYGHPVVAACVRQLGGWDAIHTDNPSADRAKWFDAYREIIARETRNATLSPSIRAFVGDGQKLLVDSGIEKLAKRMSAPANLGEKP